MTRAHLEDISNGIWMCYTHGKLIDTDEEAYSVEMLKTWKRIAEVRATLSQQLGHWVQLAPKQLSDVPLPSGKIDLSELGGENKIIGDGLASSCVEQIWGVGPARAARDLFLELTRNAFQHGGAKKATLKIEPTYIELLDDGNPFDSRDLGRLEAGSGGATSVRVLERSHRAALMHASERVGDQNRNRVSYLRAPKDILAATRCAMEVTHEIAYLSDEALTARLVVFADCRTIYLVLPEYASYSDVFLVIRALRRDLVHGKAVALVGNRLSTGVLDELKDVASDVSVLNFET
ncbi:MAG: hypothetical protein IH587_00535 [Anaerolineae bacterium]|nr:hypothetical protein [Anaerolineae bacterium]